MHTDIQVGDIVNIIDYGNSYTAYTDMFILMGFKNTVRNTITGEPNLKDRWEVFSIRGHDNKSHILFGIRNEAGNELLMNENGIKLCEKKAIPDFIFEI